MVEEAKVPEAVAGERDRRAELGAMQVRIRWAEGVGRWAEGVRPGLRWKMKRIRP